MTRPRPRLIGGSDQRGRDPDAVGVGAHRPFDDVGRPDVAADGVDSPVRTAVALHRGPPDDAEAFGVNLAERHRQFVGQPVGDVGERGDS
jgi:hypothetical protein